MRNFPASNFDQSYFNFQQAINYPDETCSHWPKNVLFLRGKFEEVLHNFSLLFLCPCNLTFVMGNQDHKIKFYKEFLVKFYKVLIIGQYPNQTAWEATDIRQLIF